MPRYAITFDLDTNAAKDAVGESVLNNEIFGTEVKEALAVCGFTEHAEGSVYHTGFLEEDESLSPIVNLQSAFRQHAPLFCRFVKSIHLFKMEGWSNITALIQTTDNVALPVDLPALKAKKKKKSPKPGKP